MTTIIWLQVPITCAKYLNIMKQHFCPKPMLQKG